MKRLIICIIFLVLNNLALAEDLYRWTEPDGSITFSPKKPPAGVDFTSVEPAASDQAAGIEPSDLPDTASVLAAATTDYEPEPPKVVAPAAQGLSYAPETSSITRASEVTEDATPPTSGVSDTNNVVSSNKRSKCLDLSKRVLSLERRLSSPLEADDMDNTVVAMARYQKSYDRHCIE